MMNQIEILDLEDDELCLTDVSQNGTTKETAISVDHYREERDFQLAIMAPILLPIPTTTKLQNFINLDDYNAEYEDLHVLNFKPEETPFSRRRKPFSSPSATEIGECSNSKNQDLSFVCEICVESKTANELFRIKGCSHAYCKDCMVMYVASKLQENITSIPCPVADCIGLLEPEYCRDILPQNVFDRWGNALCEAVILGTQKFYCPYSDCSALIIDDGGEVIRESECPYCNRLFCAQCKVPWHAEIDCKEFQKLNKDERDREDIMLMKLAQNKNWKRCPNCRYYVEKKDGCFYMKCRCKYAFCYNCGAESSTTSHMCSKCKH